MGSKKFWGYTILYLGFQSLGCFLLVFLFEADPWALFKILALLACQVLAWIYWPWAKEE